MKKLLPILSFLVLSACSGNKGGQQTVSYLRLHGNTMGTTYNITYNDPENRNFQAEVDELLKAVNNEVSTYEKGSTITRVNNAGDSIRLTGLPNDYFVSNFKLAKKVYEKTRGSFDPTVMPLVNYWGFGTSIKRAVTKIDQEKVDSLKQFVGFDKVRLEQQGDDIIVFKQDPGVALDFSACAKGGGVDAVGAFFRSKGIEDYLVDIGGELVAHGKSPRGQDWKVGISVPREDAAVDEVHTVVSLSDAAIATSGNHRNYYQTEGYKYGHTINPETGFPEKNDLLSATVFAPDCMTADAYATAFMVLGLEKALALAAEMPEIDAFFIYGKKDGSMGVKYTPGAAEYLETAQ